jgi:single-strand DNA-binding protein
MDSGSRREEVSWLQIEAWGQTAENCGKLGKKDRGVRVVGRLRQDRWTGADGKEKEKVTIVAEHVAFRPEVIEGSTVGKKKGNNG